MTGSGRIDVLELMAPLLAINCGSSSIKYAVFDAAIPESPPRDLDDGEVHRGAIDRIGSGGPPDHPSAVRAAFAELARMGVEAPSAVGHRIVHGGPDHLTPALVDDALMASLERAVPFAPLHLPAELAVVRAVNDHFGAIPQVVCFDTGFHRSLPEVAQRFALPRALFDSGLRRYGFHGLSYEFIVESLGKDALGARAVIAHLGSGASMVALRDGVSVDTTMGLTPTGGLVMGTRTGDLDPGLLVYLLAHCGYDARSLERLVNQESGLLGMSGSTPDMRALLAAVNSDERAAIAVDGFCYQGRKFIGALTAVLGGIDTLIFTGGIGEHAPEVRRRLCAGLEHLGIVLDGDRNRRGAPLISADASPCRVRVLATDEERMIARHTRRTLASAAR